MKWNATFEKDVNVYGQVTANDLTVTQEHTNHDTDIYPGLKVTQFGRGSPWISLSRARGSLTAPDALAANDVFAGIGAQGHNSAGFVEGARIQFKATGDWTNGYNGSVIEFKVSANGSANAQPATMTINHDKVTIGTQASPKSLHASLIKAGQVEVKPQWWADHVFTPDYELKSLKEVEAFIQANGHLPNMPNESQVLKDGVHVTDIMAPARKNRRAHPLCHCS